MVADVNENSLVAVRGDSDHPANRGRLCVKGATLAETQVTKGRLLRPQVDGREVDWNQALDRVAAGFADSISTHGPDSVALYLSGQLLTEDYYVANKLMKGFIGSANVDTNSRLCMSSAVVAHKRAFGEDVVPVSYADLDQAQLIIFAGSNAAWTHPVLYQRVAARKSQGTLKVVVIDPRRTATCDLADLHLQIRPGSDTALFNGLLAALAEHDAVDENFVSEHTEGFAETLEAARMDADMAAPITGLSDAQLSTFYTWFASTDRALTFFSQGINQSESGTDKANSIINVHLASGRIGRPGAGPFSITGQPNAMGGREVGGLANQLAAHQDFDPIAVNAVRSFWKAPNIVQGEGLKAVDLFKAVECGKIKALWIMGTNPAVSLPNALRVEQALAKCPLLVVSDCVEKTATTRFANVLLPAQGWGEKDGTVTNSDRRVSRQRRLLEPLGQSRPDWWIVCEVGKRLGFVDAFSFKRPAEIFREHAQLTLQFKNRKLKLVDLANLSDADYAELTPVQWGGTNPFADGQFSTPNRRARLIPVRHRLPKQQQEKELPLILNTGRSRDQWHTMTRTGVAPKLLRHADCPIATLHPAEANRRQLHDGELVELRNRQGMVRAILHVSSDLPPGQTFLTIHWNSVYAAPARVSDLIAPVTDPVSGQPESKHGIVDVHAVQVGRWLRVVSHRSQALSLESLYRSSLPSDVGQREELALVTTPSLPELAATLRLSTLRANVISLDSPTLQMAIVEQEGKAHAVLAAASSRSGLPSWTVLEQALTSSSTFWGSLRGQSASADPQVCTCFEVSKSQIQAAIAKGDKTLDQLQASLRCGTNCGSCVPELNQLLM